MILKQKFLIVLFCLLSLMGFSFFPFNTNLPEVLNVCTKAETVEIPHSTTLLYALLDFWMSF